MESHKKNLLTRILIWRMKHVPQKQFIIILSALVGLISGLGAVLIKNLTYLIKDVLEGQLIREYQSAFYFIFPLIGLGLVYVYITYVLRHKVSHGIPSTLYAIAKKKGVIKRFQMFGSLIAAPITVGLGVQLG